MTERRRRSEAHIQRRSFPHVYLMRIIDLVKFCLHYKDERCLIKTITAYPELIAMHEEPLNFEVGSWEAETLLLIPYQRLQ